MGEDTGALFDRSIEAEDKEGDAPHLDALLELAVKEGCGRVQSPDSARLLFRRAHDAHKDAGVVEVGRNFDARYRDEAAEARVADFAQEQVAQLIADQVVYAFGTARHRSVQPRR